jgi:cobalt-zinc-cadmium efflux system outer membrane protein
MTRASLAALTMTLLGAGCAPLDVGAPAAPGLPALEPGSGRTARTAAGPGDPRGDLGLRRAVDTALASSPRLRAAAAERRVRAAGERYAGEYPNPEIAVDLEDVLGSGALRGAREAQVTVVVAQTVELGGKGRARRAQARVATRTADWRYLARRAEVIARVAERFVGALLAQARLEAATRAERLAGQVLAAMRDRLQAGRVIPAAVTEAEIRRSLAAMEVDRARTELRRARLALAAEWGGDSDGFGRLLGDLGALPEVPLLEPLERRLANHPALREHDLRLARRRADLAAERAAGVPDLSVRVGYRYLSGPESSAAVLGLSLPLPILSRNRGAAAMARLRVEQAAEERPLRLAALRGSLRRAHAAVALAHREVAVLRGTVLPAARQAFASVDEAFRLGRGSYLGLLAAQATLLEMEGRLLDALAAAHRTRVALFRAAGVIDPTAGDEGVQR